MRRRGKIALLAAAPLFAALGDPTRLAIALHLGDAGPTSITGLVAEARVTRQAVAKHLRVLEKVGLAKASRQGRERVFELLPDKLEEARTHLAAISARWDLSLDRLKTLVEAT